MLLRGSRLPGTLGESRACVWALRDDNPTRRSGNSLAGVKPLRLICKDKPANPDDMALALQISKVITDLQ